MTVLEVIKKSSEFLEKKGIESPRLNAELLLSHVLEVPRLKLYLDFERKLEVPEADKLRDLVKRRGSGEPLQHLLGTVSFCGYEIETRPGALIPRPETEILAELGWEFLKSVKKEEPTFLDFGTGTGCVAIAIAKHVPHGRGYAVEISPEAFEIAQQNIQRHGSRIQALLSDGFSAIPRDQQFDLIVSNPPYIPTAEIPTLAVEVREHDPAGALDGGEDGLKFYRRLASEAAVRLHEGGKLMAEFGDGQAEAIRKIFLDVDWIVEEIRADYTARPRFIIAHRS
jgi:release factor glutamine methyltransferase